MFKRSILAIPALLLSGALAFAQEAEPKFTLPHISVTGSSSVQARPDIAILSLGVISEKPTPAAAETDNATAATSVIAALKNLGIDPKDIKTSSLTLTPVMVEERDPKTNGVVKRTLTGYRATNSLEVRIRDVEKAGSVASRVVEMGANTYQGLRFELSDEESRRDELRAKAVTEAMRRAKLFAHGASMKLGRLLAIDPEPERRGYGGEADLPARRVEPGPHVVVIPVEPGLIRVESQVTATWELVPE